MNSFNYPVTLGVSLLCLLLKLNFCSPSPLLPFKEFRSQLLITSNQVNHGPPVWKLPRILLFLQEGGRGKDEDEGHQRSTIPNSRSKGLFPIVGPLVVQGVRVPPILRNLMILRQRPSLPSLGFGITFGLGCFMLSASHAEAKIGKPLTSDDDNKPSQLPVHVVIGRVVKFWKRVGPIIIHYKWATFWMNKVKVYDRSQRDEIYESLHQRYAPQAKNAAYEMKGLFIKIGQVLSSRPDFMPSVYIDNFSELQDNVPTHPVDEIKSELSKSLFKYHGLHFNDVFETFAEEPLGSASIGSVHAATLTNDFLKANELSYSGGKEVAVKVMHVDAEDRFRNDFKILKWVCRLALPGWSPILPELERQFMTEFDYLNEAESLKSVRKNILSSPYKKYVYVPEPLCKFSTKNVLIMEKLEGDKLVSDAYHKLTNALNGDKTLAKILMEERRKAIMKGDLSTRSAKDDIRMVQKNIAHHPILDQISIMWKMASLVRTQRKYVDLLLDVHGYQIFINGQFNGDPHPGNILVLPNGKLGLIDYGQCYKLSTKDRMSISSIIKELGSNEIDTSLVSSAMRQFGFKFKYNKDNIVTEMAKLLFDSDTARIELGLPTPQELMNHWGSQDPMEFCPDAAVFISRTSFLFRGMGTMTGMNIHTAPRWRHHALKALKKGNLSATDQ